MSKVPYTKPALTYTALLKQLKDRGLIVENEPKALHLLEVISYYRLSGYWYPMLSTPKSAHNFKVGSTFENAFKLYCFDRELRKLVLGELEKIEVAVRAKMIDIMWHSHGPFWYNDTSLFSGNLSKTLDKMKEEFERSDEQFIKSFKNNYSDPLPPACMMLEISSFGTTSTLYSKLKAVGRNKRNIANFFGVDETTFESWLHSFTYVRNVCAHHGRLWNKIMSISPKVPLTPIRQFLNITTLPNPVVGQPPVLNNNKTYFLLSMIIYLLNTINPKHSFQLKFSKLLKIYPMIQVNALGFPEGWETEPLWDWKKSAAIK